MAQTVVVASVAVGEERRAEVVEVYRVEWAAAVEAERGEVTRGQRARGNGCEFSRCTRDAAEGAGDAAGAADAAARGTWASTSAGRAVGGPRSRGVREGGRPRRPRRPHHPLRRYDSGK